jgi:hypothetical protein
MQRRRSGPWTGVEGKVGAVELVRDDHAAFADPAISSLSSSAAQRQVVIGK